MSKAPDRAVGARRRKYARSTVEITSIEFVPVTEEERRKAIAALVELFLPLVHPPEEGERAA